MSSPFILVVDDEPDIRTLVQEILEDEGYEVHIAEDADGARDARRARRPDLILLDIWMPDTDGITLLKEWSEGDTLDTPVIMMSGHGTVETAVEATRLGAYDFIEKPLSIAKLLLTVRRALEAVTLRAENVGLRRQAQPVTEPMGRGSAMQMLREQIRRVAQHDTPVLISGASGSGKEVCARYLHAQSDRGEGPFVRVAVAGIMSSDSTVELFGGEEGNAVHFGSLERANGGTVFLQDIADMDVQLQARLLGAIQHRSFVRVGGVAPVQFDARIIAATTHDLSRRVEEGSFREDLYYHLSVVPLEVPALREHREDIPELLDYYVNLFVGQESLPYRRFTVACQNYLRNYPWPGNVRELKNLVQRMLILGTGPEIELEEVETALGESPRTTPDDAAGASFELPLKEARERFERSYLEHQLRLTGGNMSRLAERVGMERTHLYRKLRALGIDSKQVVGTDS